MNEQLTTLQKIKRSKQDPVFFLKNFAIIRHPIKGKIPFNLFGFQQDVIHALVKNRFNSIGKSRQLGISTVVAGYIAWLMMFNKDKQISVICTKQRTAINMIRKIKLIYKQLPQSLKPVIVQDNKMSIALANGSKCYAQGRSQDAGRSQSLSLLVLDQARFIQGIQNVWKAAYPTLSTGGSCILLSTPHGVNWFHKMHTARRRLQNQFNRIDLPWYLHPQRGQRWKQKQIKNLNGEKEFRQQHQIDFQASGRSIIDLQVLARMQRDIKKNFSPLTKNQHVTDLYNKILGHIAEQGITVSRQTIEKLWIFDLPQPGVQYALTCDTSSGVGDDYSTIHVWDVQQYHQRRQLRRKLKPNIFAHVIMLVARFYNDAYVAVQSNKDGSAVNIKLQQLKYTNMHYMQRKRKNDFGQKMQVPGFQTNGTTRPVMVAKMQNDVAKKLAGIRSLRTIQQLKTFVDAGGKAQRLQGYNDDLVIRFRIFRYLRNYIIMKKADWQLVNRYSSSRESDPVRIVSSSQNKQIEGWYI